MKYIDADKLIAEIERLREEYNNSIPVKVSIHKLETKDFIRMGIVEVLDKVLLFAHGSIIQQEQPEGGCSEKPNNLLSERTEEDLEKEMDKYFSNWLQGASDEGCFNADSQLVSIYDCRRIALHFYELGQRTKYQQDKAEFAKLKAKEWQDGYDEGYAKGLNARKK